MEKVACVGEETDPEKNNRDCTAGTKGYGEWKTGRWPNFWLPHYILFSAGVEQCKRKVTEEKENKSANYTTNRNKMRKRGEGTGKKWMLWSKGSWRHSTADHLAMCSWTSLVTTTAVCMFVFVFVRAWERSHVHPCVCLGWPSLEGWINAWLM